MRFVAVSVSSRCLSKGVSAPSNQVSAAHLEYEWVSACTASFPGRTVQQQECTKDRRRVKPQ